MESITAQLTRRIRDALNKLGIEAEPAVQVSQDEKFGDYQSNVAMVAAKQQGKKPRDLAQQIIENLSLDDLCNPPEIAGPGFLNFRLKPEFLSRLLEPIPPAPRPPVGERGEAANQNRDHSEPRTSVRADLLSPNRDREGAECLFPDRLGIAPAESPQVVAVDLSSPNLAKEMHVGHLRSTVIGDCIARVLEFQGHTVHRENHVGDWGTQFGMLVAYLRRKVLNIPKGVSGRFETVDDPLVDLSVSRAGAEVNSPLEVEKLAINDLESFYVQAKSLFDADDDFKTESRETVVALQRGDETVRRIWKAFCHESLRHCHAIYERLGVRLEDRGESSYADLMDEAIARLERMQGDEQLGVRESEGALCVFLDGFTTRDGEPLPLIVRKSDGGHNYATSDLATIIDRVERLGATRIIYVVGIAQKQHFDMLFAAARKVGFISEGVSLEHIGFGNMLTRDGRPFKTREGGTIKLKNLLDDAVARARRILDEAQSDEDRPPRSLSPEQAGQIAETVGIAAVKYFDLSHSLTSDYKFDPDIMLAMDGNTAPYMLYAYARIASIGRKAGVQFSALASDAPILLEHPAEVALAKRLAQFPDVIATVGRELRPNVLTDYLYELSRTFSRFYDKKLGVRVIDASPEQTRVSRLRLCDLTARVLRLGLDLLSIQTVEQM